MGRAGVKRWPGVAASPNSAILLQRKLRLGGGGEWKVFVQDTPAECAL